MGDPLGVKVELWNSAKSVVRVIGGGAPAAALSVRGRGPEAEVGEMRVGEGGAPTAQGPPRDNCGKGKGGAAQAEAELRSAPEDPQLQSAPPWSAADAATL